MALTRMLRVAVTFAAVVAAGLVGWWLWNIYTLSPWTRDARVRADIVNLAPDVTGLITALNVSDNQKVAKGDTLFVIDQKRYSLALAEAQASVAEAQSTLKLAEDDAGRDAEILAGDPSAISTAAAETTRSRAAQAAAALQLAEAQRATAELDLERSTVRAPVNGYVTNLTAVVGNYATRGTGVMALVDVDSYYIDAYFMETKLPAIRVGDTVDIRLMAGGATLRGTVQGLSRAIASPTASTGALLATVDPNFEWIRLAQRIPVHIEITDIPAGVELAAGMSATVVVKPTPAR